MNQLSKTVATVVKKPITAMGLAILLFTSVAGCETSHSQTTHSADCVNICRQFVAEAGNTMQALNRDTFEPKDLTFRQLKVLTSDDPYFAGGKFLVLNQPWKFEEGGMKIVIICTRSWATEQGGRQYFVGYNSGDHGWLDEGDLFHLRWGDYIELPEVR